MYLNKLHTNKYYVAFLETPPPTVAKFLVPPVNEALAVAATLILSAEIVVN